MKDPAACAAKEANRYAIIGVSTVKRGEDTYLAATDGHMLSMIRCQPEEGDNTPGGIYPPAAFAAARKAARKGADASLRLNGSAIVRTADSTAEFPAIDMRFPDVLGVIPSGVPSRVLYLDASKLATIQKALGADAVEVEMRDVPDHPNDTLPLVIRPIYTDGGCSDRSFAVLMPLAPPK
jgi:DNA polymerase III sliding clamp (beta) subunit (PCNA family)